MANMERRVKKLEDVIGTGQGVPESEPPAIIWGRDLTPEEIENEEAEITQRWIERYGSAEGGKIILVRYEDESGQKELE
ncbi:MAG: hypothetical protein JRK53_03065 [Deltaproteobacteria bacterium]|nr:hypothetical protein [Deltaproteobacteria bacterium]MBW1818703.1 hypothetical protein [Deltaproteobacteria bacterium]